MREGYVSYARYYEMQGTSPDLAGRVQPKHCAKDILNMEREVREGLPVFVRAECGGNQHCNHSMPRLPGCAKTCSSPQFAFAKFLVAAGPNAWLTLQCGGYDDDRTAWFDEFKMKVGAPLEPMQKGADGISFSRRFTNADVNVSCTAQHGSSSIVWKSDDEAAADLPQVPPPVPPQVMCVDSEPPAPSPTDRLWRPRYHHVGYNQTKRGHIQDPSGVIFDVATQTWHLFNDCWPCQPQPSLHWCHISSKDLVHWKTHPVIRDSRPQFHNAPWSVGTGSIGRATNGSYFAFFGGCARTEDPDFEEWTTLATPGYCMCDNIPDPTAVPHGPAGQLLRGLRDDPAR
eukprot:SAG11_NODE_407_length_9712_cov_11.569437_7_plen_343_part_00